ncbi:acetolactate synthase small subunit [Pectinatus brassicae]|uniref:Acetolactate synthase small subunit n=1 Tax=Pectinatus brassicae TaxID=862415 RepID=A0A840UHV2_9FIRM|nr:acetolactate synthase small subunit [Pectinatus brassicae]MBB5335127.1 acetolactate synthase-1/3 small subunit [Pectinatus brassicae]
MKYQIAILAENKPGVLTHVSGLISRRDFNIETINAGYTEENDVTRINIVVNAYDKMELNKVIHQMAKLIDVIKIVNISELPSVSRELILVKVKADSAQGRADVVNIANIFRAHIVDVGHQNLVVELTGEEDKLAALTDMLSCYEIIEIARTGPIALSRGIIPIKNM